MSADLPPPITVPLPPPLECNSFEPNAALGPELCDLLVQASRGGLSAQRQMRDACSSAFVHRHAHIPNHDLCATYSVMLARLCAANGDESDAERLAAILLNAGVRFGEWRRDDLAHQFAAEALSIFERLGLRGDDDAAQTAEKIVGLLPSLVDLAKSMMKKDPAL